jgi:cytochrome c
MAQSPLRARRSAGTVAHALAAVVLLCAAVGAAASPELARQRNCMNCHALERKLVGPSFRDVAARYAGQPDAAPRLARKIVQGGAGAWGPVAMAANPQVSAVEANKLAAWVLSVK